MTTDDRATRSDPYQALRSGRGFVLLSDWSSIALSGADRQNFLHNFCTNDVRRLAPGDASEAFFCNVKGKIVGHGLVTCRDSELVVIGAPGQGTSLAKHLDRFVIREDVAIRDTTAERAVLFVAGGELSDLPRETSGFRWRLVDRKDARLLDVPFDQRATVMTDLAARGWTSCAGDVFDTLRIESGTPLYGVDFDDENLPQEVARNAQAISFNKGCYLGQETVARIDALGHVNRQIVGVAFSGGVAPARGSELTHDGNLVGRVTSAAFSRALSRPLALAMVRREWTSPGTRLDSSVGPAEVVVLPR